jgi:Tol biopolymer transport system component
MRRTLRLPLSALALPLLGGALAAQSTTRISVDSAGNEARGPSSSPAFSYDGRFVAFESQAANLVPGDTNGMRDIFVVELATGLVERVSISDTGAQADSLCTRPSLSHDGRYVAFHSGASTLVPGDTNGLSDVFVRDRLLGTTRLVSVTPGGTPGNSLSSFGALSADGRCVAFSSLATDLVAGDTNGTIDVFVRDLAAGTTERVSVSSAGLQSDGYSTFAAISADGRCVAFQSVATNLVPGDTNGQGDIFVRDRLSGTTERVSSATGGAEADGASSIAALSADGRFVAFQSTATNLVPGDTNGMDDVFVRDRLAGTTVRVSVSLSGGQGDQPSVAPAISADGRSVAFVCQSEILIPGDTNFQRDVIVHDLVSGDLERLSIDSFALECDGMSIAVALDASGTRAVFQSYGDNLVANDTNNAPDVFLRLRGPFHPLSCAGDGSLPQPCPCGNSGAPGHGCANSAVAAGGLLEGEGGTALDEITLVAHDLLPHALAIFLQGDTFVSGGFVFGDGLRCVSGALRRLYVMHAEFGVASAPGPYDLGLRGRAQALGDPLPPGSLRGYQVYYRDPDANFCPAPSGNTWNVTNAVEVQW